MILLKKLLIVCFCALAIPIYSQSDYVTLSLKAYQKKDYASAKGHIEAAVKAANLNKLAKTHVLRGYI